MSSDDNKLAHNPHDICQQVVGFFRDRVSELRIAVSGCGQSSVPRALHSNHSNGWAHQSPKILESGRIAESSYSRTASLTSDQAALLAGQAFTSSVTKEDLGRATWLLLHTVAAQYPANPSKQQRKDVAALVDTLTRIYPCGECASHFQELVRRNAPATGSAQELRQWMCNMHNNVNRSLGKAEFNCELVDARWNGLDCGDDMACDIKSRMGRGSR